MSRSISIKCWLAAADSALALPCRSFGRSFVLSSRHPTILTLLRLPFPLSSRLERTLLLFWCRVAAGRSFSFVRSVALDSHEITTAATSRTVTSDCHDFCRRPYQSPRALSFFGHCLPACLPFACSGVPSLITKKQIYNLYTYILYSYVFSERRDSLPVCFFSYTASAAAAS